MVIEIERRFLVFHYDPCKLREAQEVWTIEQGYLVTNGWSQVRIRIINSERALQGIKIGEGIEREEYEEEISLQHGRRLLRASRFCLTKIRYFLGGWEVDLYQGNLLGIVIAEKPLQSKGEQVALPPWIDDAVDVTEVHGFGNIALGRLSHNLGKLGPAQSKEKLHQFLNDMKFQSLKPAA